MEAENDDGSTFGSRSGSSEDEYVERDGTSAPDTPTPSTRDVGTDAELSDHLVSETALEELGEESDDVASPPSAGVPPELTSLRGALERLGADPKIVGTEGRYFLQFDLQAGRSSRSVTVNVEGAKALMGVDLSAWRSLRRYDGIWSQAESTIEVVLRGERFGLSIAPRLRRLSGAAPAERGDPGPFVVDLEDEQTGTSLQIGTASDIAFALLSGSRPWRRGSIITLRISGIPVFTADEADTLAERFADSVSVDFDIALGVLLRPQRLEDRSELRARLSRPLRPPRFPHNNYPHAAVLLYMAGRDRTSPPLIRYWSYYQVLEYFFPKHSQAEVLNQVARLLRSPAFDAHRDEDVLKAIELASSTRTGSVNEEQQLLTTLKAITSPKELIDIVKALSLEEHLENRKSELTSISLRVAATDDLLAQMARRIYDIRCRIVHSKSGSQRDFGPGLLPGTHHDDLVERELPLMEYLAQQALVTSAEPLIRATRPIIS